MLKKTALASSLGLVTLLIPALARAQATPETAPGVLTLSRTGMNVGEPLASSDKKTVTAAEDALIALLKRNPALASPIGYDVVLHRSDGRTQTASAFGLPIDYGVTSYIWYKGWETGPSGARSIATNNGRFNFTVLVNATGQGADVNEPLAADGGPSLIRGYRRTGTFRGHDVYDGECVFITASGRAPLIPVTRERYLTAKIAELRQSSARHTAQQQAAGTSVMSDHYAKFLRDRPKREAEMRKVYDEIKKSDPASANTMMEEWKKAETESEQQIRNANGGADVDRQLQQARAEGNAAAAEAIQRLESELAAMSPTDRKRPAFIVNLGVGQTRLAGDGDEEATPLVQVNEAAYDKSLGPDAPQVLSACLPGLQEGFPKEDREWTPQRARDAILIRDGLDWASLEAIVKRKTQDFRLR
jgi:hypothetical protein